MKGGDPHIYLTPTKKPIKPIRYPARPTKPNEKLRYEEEENEYIGTFERYFPENIENFQKKLENEKQFYEEELYKAKIEKDKDKAKIEKDKDKAKIQKYKNMLEQIDVLKKKLPKIIEIQQNLSLFGQYTLPNTSIEVDEETKLNDLLYEIKLLQQRYQDLIEAEANPNNNLEPGLVMFGGKKKRTRKNKKLKKVKRKTKRNKRSKKSKKN